MPNPQQPEMRRSERTSVTEGAPEATDPKMTRKKGHAKHTDKGNKGGGEGGGTRRTSGRRTLVSGCGRAVPGQTGTARPCVACGTRREGRDKR